MDRIFGGVNTTVNKYAYVNKIDGGVGVGGGGCGGIPDHSYETPWRGLEVKIADICCAGSDCLWGPAEDSSQ